MAYEQVHMDIDGHAVGCLRGALLLLVQGGAYASI